MEIFRTLVVKWNFQTPIAGHYAPQSAGPKPIPNVFGGFDDSLKVSYWRGQPQFLKPKNPVLNLVNDGFIKLI